MTEVIFIKILTLYKFSKIARLSFDCKKMFFVFDCKLSGSLYYIKNIYNNFITNKKYI